MRISHNDTVEEIQEVDASMIPSVNKENTDALIEEPITNEMPYYFKDEAELIEAINSKKYADAVSNINEYYKPKNVPSGFSLQYISIKDFYIALYYNTDSNNARADTIDSGEYYMLEWFRTMSEGDLEDSLNRMYTEKDIVLKEGSYYIIPSDTLQDVYWEQDSLAFHAVTPSDISDEVLEDFCTAVSVPIK